MSGGKKERAMNIRDIARLADVTPGTVSKVLNNYPDVGEATRQHVLKIIAENQYEPKGRGKKAEALPPRIGMVVESVYNPFYSEVEDSLSIHLHNAGYTLISFHDNFFAQNKREKFAELLTDFQPEKLNGLIYIGGNFEEVTPEEFSQLPCPTIFVNTMLPYPTGKLLYSSVQVSQFATAYAQMERLIGQGHRDICTIISSNIDTSVYSLRYRAYRAALSQNGLEKNLAAFLETDYQFDKAYGAVHSSGNTMTVGSMGCPAMTRKLVASYLMKDGSRFTDKAGWETMTFQQETQDRDPRLAQSIRTPGYKRMDQETFTAPDLKVSFTGYHPDKYVTTLDQDSYNNSDIDLIIFRAAEVMLNYAEALADAGTLTQDDLDLSVNKLRDRVGMPHLSMADANGNPDAFLTDPAFGGYLSSVLASDANKGVILEIRRERAIELCQEGHRYYDLMRWKEGKVFEAPFYGMYLPGVGVYDLDGNGTADFEVYAASATSGAAVTKKLGSDVILKDGDAGMILLHSDVSRTWNEDRDYLYPIPTDDRNLTGGALTQNPGWNDGLKF